MFAINFALQLDKRVFTSYLSANKEQLIINDMTDGFQRLVRRPGIRQFLATDLLLTLTCIAGLIVAGIDGVFMGTSCCGHPWP
jgi:hypothetical protein